MNGLVERVGAMTLTCALCLCCTATANGAMGDVDTRFGSLGRLEVGDTYNTVGLEQLDGKWLMLGRPIVVTGNDFNQLAISRYHSNGQLDEAFGQAGRIRVPMPVGNEPTFGAAALQPDGKIVVAGAGGVGANQWVRYVARLDSNGAPDPTFGAGGVVDGGYAGDGFDGFGAGYSALLVLPSGDILAVINDHGTVAVDRISASGTRLASTPIDATPVAMAPQGQEDAILLLRQPGSAIFKRLRRDGSFDPNFGQGGQTVLAGMDPTVVTIVAADARVIACGSTGIQRLTADGRADASFGSDGNGFVRFDGRSAPKASRCDGLALDDDGNLLAIASDVQGTLAVSHHAYVLGLTADGAVDARLGGGTGFVPIHGLTLPGTQWQGQALHLPQGRNPSMTWRVVAFDTARLVVESIDMGRGEARGAVGSPNPTLRISEKAGTYELRIVRNGSPAGVASVRFESLTGSATANDFGSTNGQLAWADGDGAAKTIRLVVTDDAESEGEETFRVRLFDATGVDAAAEPMAITIVDDDALRGLRFDDRNITWTSGPSIPQSSWAKWKLHLDDPMAGPVTTYFYFTNGFDSCCAGQLQWAARESGFQTIRPFAGDTLGNSYNVVLLDDWWNATGPEASVKVVIDPTPSITPPGTRSESGSGANAGGAAGGGTFDAPFALLLLLAAVPAVNRRRRSPCAEKVAGDPVVFRRSRLRA